MNGLFAKSSCPAGLNDPLPFALDSTPVPPVH
jgi:hypothetical protein